MATSLTKDQTYTTDSLPGVALRFISYAQVYEPFTFYYYPDDDTDTMIEVESEFGEYVDDPDIAIMCALGDDRYFYVPIEDLAPLKEGEFCASCGQIGCTADARDND